MADFVTWIGTFMTLDIATIGTVEVTMGLMVALGLISTAALAVIRKVKGRS